MVPDDEIRPRGARFVSDFCLEIVAASIFSANSFLYISAAKGFQDWCKSGSPHVTKVVDSIVSPLMSQFPRPRYVIGSDAWLLKLTSYLPEVLQDIILRDFPFKVPTASDDRANSVFPQMNGSVS